MCLQPTFSLLLAHDRGRVFLGLLVFTAGHGILRFLVTGLAIAEGTGSPTNRTGRLLEGFGPIVVALVSPSHGARVDASMDGARKMKKRGANNFPAATNHMDP